jgi:prepilin-type N-terminal cleavage/methylation domain-containing protein
MRTNGFTVVETMICIAIVALLLAGVVLSLSYYITKTEELECRGNIKMLHHAIMEYSIDCGLKPGDTVTVSNMYPRYWTTIDSGTCPKADMSYGDSFTVGTVPTCPGNIESHAWDPEEDLGL